VTIRGLLLDAAGTVLRPATSVAATYLEAARAHGCTRTLADVRAAFGPAMDSLRALRAGDPSWLRYWRAVIATATGIDSAALTDTLYAHYTHAHAWVFEPEAPNLLRACQDRRMPVAIVSNWDERLRDLMADMCATAGIIVPELVISAEEGIEKPDPEIFWRACARLRIPAEAALMIGDSQAHDVEGAAAAGCQAWRVGGPDAPSLAHVEARLFGPSSPTAPRT